MKFTILILSILAFMLLFSACGSLDDGSAYISKITRLTPEEVISGPFAGKNKIELTNKDDFLDWFYTDQEFSLGDTLVYVPIADKVALTELQIQNTKLVDLLANQQVNSELIISTLTSELQLSTNFKTQVKALMNELEEDLVLISEDASNEN